MLCCYPRKDNMTKEQVNNIIKFLQAFVDDDKDLQYLTGDNEWKYAEEWDLDGYTFDTMATNPEYFRIVSEDEDGYWSYE